MCVQKLFNHVEKSLSLFNMAVLAFTYVHLGQFMKKRNFGQIIANLWPSLKKWLCLTNIDPFFFSKDFQYIRPTKMYSLMNGDLVYTWFCLLPPAPWVLLRPSKLICIFCQIQKKDSHSNFHLKGLLFFSEKVSNPITNLFCNKKVGVPHQKMGSWPKKHDFRVFGVKWPFFEVWHPLFCF